ncbi:hypothetical protein HDU76_012456 [Blyttiomyces sp. JEL0837]|nr:hypothetical protein HDU76_012456 [Blyttiomyces sp. JEL0837]
MTVLWILSLVVLLCGSAFSKQIKSQFSATLIGDDLDQFVNEFNDAENLTQTGSFLAPFLIPRVSGSAGNKKVQTFLIDTFTNLGWNIEQDKFTDKTPIGKKEFNNIVVTKDPDAPRKIVLAAHFDSKWFEEFDFIGATDSAVPCAILVDLATALDPHLTKQMKEKNGKAATTTLQLIFFDGEEAFKTWTATDSLYGSRHLAQKWEKLMVKRPNGSEVSVLKTIDVLILLDLLGYHSSTMINYFKQTSWVWDRLVSIEGRLAIQGLLSAEKTKKVVKSYEPAYFIPGMSPMANYGIEDDHKPFLERGVPIVHVIAAPFPPVWHRKSDDATAISPSVVQDLARIFRVLVAEYLGLV